MTLPIVETAQDGNAERKDNRTLWGPNIEANEETMTLCKGNTKGEAK